MPRGKKSCPECHAEVGPRLAVCECGFEFTFNQGKAPGKRKAPRPPKVGTPHEPTEDDEVPAIVSAGDRGELDSFIAQLQACRDESNRSGGCYSAFLRHKFGTLKVEVYFPMRLE